MNGTIDYTNTHLVLFVHIDKAEILHEPRFKVVKVCGNREMTRIQS